MGLPTLPNALEVGWRPAVSTPPKSVQERIHERISPVVEGSIRKFKAFVFKPGPKHLYSSPGDLDRRGEEGGRKEKKRNANIRPIIKRFYPYNTFDPLALICMHVRSSVIGKPGLRTAKGPLTGGWSRMTRWRFRKEMKMISSLWWERKSSSYIIIRISTGRAAKRHWRRGWSSTGI